MGLDKLELHINDVCYNKVFDMKFNMKNKGASFQRFGLNRTVFKATNLNTGIKGLQEDAGNLCFNIVAPCQTLEQFCFNGVCNFSLLDEDNKCCPTGYTGIASR